LCGTKSKTLKLAPLLAQYLYEQKKLQLTGIGTFLLDPSARVSTDVEHISQGISFEFGSVARDDDSLVSYISTQTGKMKALASSDLNSYVDLAREFLNIGKPFQIEGIGTLVKTKSGEFEFTADHVLADKVKENGIKELSATSTSDDSLTTYETLKPQAEQTLGSRRIFLGFLAVITIAFIVWISYRTYKTTTTTDVREEQKPEEVVAVTDTTKYASSTINNTVPDKPAEVTSNPGSYRFVIEVANKKRAYYRYNTLKGQNVPVQIATNDSVSYKLFFTLPATVADTARIRDSLSIWYPALNHKKAFVEK